MQSPTHKTGDAKAPSSRRAAPATRARARMRECAQAPAQISLKIPKRVLGGRRGYARSSGEHVPFLAPSSGPCDGRGADDRVSQRKAIAGTSSRPSPNRERGRRTLHARRRSGRRLPRGVHAALPHAARPQDGPSAQERGTGTRWGDGARAGGQNGGARERGSEGRREAARPSLTPLRPAVCSSRSRRPPTWSQAQTTCGWRRRSPRGPMRRRS